MIKRILEALLMAASEPLSLDYLHKLVISNGIDIEKRDVRRFLDELTQDYQERAVELKEVASGYRLQVRQDMATWVNKLWEEKPPRYSRAFLETLAIIVYKQPATRAEIEEVRGVSVSSNIIKTLLEHGWIKVVGYKEVPGRPALYATTAKFLDYFNLRSLAELPSLQDAVEIAVAETESEIIAETAEELLAAQEPQDLIEEM